MARKKIGGREALKAARARARETTLFLLGKRSEPNPRHLEMLTRMSHEPNRAPE